MTNENTVKSTVGYATDKIHHGVNTTEETIDESVNAVGARLASIETFLRDSSERLLSNAKEMSGFAEKQLRIHPLAALGVAVAAGIAVARLMRR